MFFNKLLAKAALLLCFSMMLFSCNEQIETQVVSVDRLSTQSRGVQKQESFRDVLRVVLEKALSDQRLPMKDELMKNHYFKDSVLLCIDFPQAITDTEIPEVGNLRFKVLPKEELCRLLISKNQQATPPYLYIHSIVKDADGINLKIDNSCITAVKISANADVCDYISHCGGGMEIRCVREAGIWNGDIVRQWER